MLRPIVVACVALFTGCGTPRRTESTTALERQPIPMGAEDRRALSMLPESVFAVARVDLSAFSNEPAFEELHAAFAEADPESAATVDEIQAIYVGVGPWIDAERMCLSAPFVPEPDGCPEPEDDEYAELYDRADALRAYRVGPGRRVMSFYVLLRMRSPDFCSSITADGSTDPRGLRILRRAGAVVFDAGDGLCGFAPDLLASSLRSANGDVVSPGALELGGARSRMIADVAVSGRSGDLRTFLTLDEPDEVGVEFAGLPMFRMIAPLFESMQTLHVDASTEDVSALRVEARAVYADAESARDTEAILDFLIHVVDEYATALAGAYGREAPEPLHTLTTIDVERGGRTDHVSVPFAEGSLEHVAGEFLLMNGAYRRRLYGSDYGDGADDPDDAGHVNWYRTLEQARNMPPREAFARIASVRTSTMDDYGRLTILRALVARAAEAGAFVELDAARQQLHGLLEATDEYDPHAWLDYFSSGVGVALLRNDPSALTSIADEIDAYVAESDAEWVTEPLEVLSRAIRDRIVPWMRRPRPAVTRNAADAPLVDRRATMIPDPGLWAIDESLTLGDWSGVLAIERFLETQDRSNVTEYHGQVVGFTGPQLEIRFALGHLGAGRPAEAIALLDEALGPESTPDYAERTELTWVRCRAMRFAPSDTAALPTCRQAVEFAVFTHGPDHPNTARAKVELAEAELGAGHRDVARRLGGEALAALEASTHASHPLRATARALARGGR